MLVVMLERGVDPIREWCGCGCAGVGAGADGAERGVRVCVQLRAGLGAICCFNALSISSLSRCAGGQNLFSRSIE